MITPEECSWTAGKDLLLSKTRKN